MGFMEPRESVAHLALRRQPDMILTEAVAAARRLTGTESAFAAVRRKSGSYAIAVREGLSDPRWSQIRVMTGLGMGGQVLAERRPYACSDYLRDSHITRDYRAVVSAEGLHGMACVPIMKPDGVAALLYAGHRHVGGIGDRIVDELTRIADMAEVGLTMCSGDAMSANPPAVHLTAREWDVLELLGEGASNRAISEQLLLAEPTVKGHVRRLLEKFGASSRLEVVTFARRAEMI
jgi:DNA-binding CsgD family transcriptional regulator